MRNHKVALTFFAVMLIYTSLLYSVDTFDHVIKSAQTGFLKTEERRKIRYAHWKAHGKPKPYAIVIFQGRASFIEKHTEFIKDMRAKGYEVFAFDWVGQGASTRLLENAHKSHIETYDEYINNAKQFINEIVLKKTPKPIIIFASSMGGHIALRYLMEDPNKVAAAVLEAPMLDIPTKPFPRWLAKAFVYAGTWMGAGGLYAPGYGNYYPERYVFDEKKSNTSDKIRFERQKQYTLLYPDYVNGGPTIGWVKATFDSIAEMRKPGNLRKIRVPVLIMDAGKDKYVLNEEDEKMCEQLPKCKITFYPEARHHIAVEADPIRNKFLRDIDNFIKLSVKG